MNNLNISQPDPDWDYYEVWQSLHTIRTKIDAGIKLISGEETGDSTIDKKLKEILEPALEQHHQLSAEQIEKILGELKNL